MVAANFVPAYGAQFFNDVFCVGLVTHGASRRQIRASLTTGACGKQIRWIQIGVAERLLFGAALVRCTLGHILLGSSRGPAARARSFGPWAQIERGHVEGHEACLLVHRHARPHVAAAYTNPRSAFNRNVYTVTEFTSGLAATLSAVCGLHLFKHYSMRHVNPAHVVLHEYCLNVTGAGRRYAR